MDLQYVADLAREHPYVAFGFLSANALWYGVKTYVFMSRFCSGDVRRDNIGKYLAWTALPFGIDAFYGAASGLLTK